MAENRDGMEKSEEATSKKKEDTRKEGQVAKSVDLTSGVLLFTAVLILYYYTPYFIDSFKQLFREFLEFDGYNINQESIYYLYIFSLKFMMKVTMPFFAALFLVAFVINVLQVGFFITGKSISPKFEKLNFFTNFTKTFFSVRKVVDLIKSVFKLFVLSLVAWYTVKDDIDIMIRMTDADIIDQMTYMASITFEILVKISILVLILGFADYMYQKWQHSQDIKMTKQDIKEEMKQSEGDPLVKNRIRQAQREAARKRMMDDVPKSDVVITNPTHYAVAIKYDPREDAAPKVVAKGQRLMALKIRELAIKHGIKIVQDPPLARLLYDSVDIGDDIPQNLYQALATILMTLDKFKRAG